MLGKKNTQKYWPTYIKFLINVGQHYRQKEVISHVGAVCGAPTCWTTFLNVS